MVKCILDTDILSEYLKGHHPNVITKASRYAKEHGVVSFTSLTVYEIVYGLALKSAASHLTKALAWLNQNEEITSTSADYLAAGRIKATARSRVPPLSSPIA
ncbi:MAG TPA: PIN domain-containing protein [Candidatus Bathyarchaeia archaeon]|nr:PIN domain-containing protein [Candidatus Bathyarchaeia archaeon]